MSDDLYERLLDELAALDAEDADSAPLPEPPVYTRRRRGAGELAADLRWALPRAALGAVAMGALCLGAGWVVVEAVRRAAGM